MANHPFHSLPGARCCMAGRSLISPQKPCGSGSPYQGSRQTKGASFPTGAHASQVGAEEETLAMRLRRRSNSWIAVIWAPSKISASCSKVAAVMGTSALAN